MIKLYGFKPLWGLADISAFVLKVDLYLRMTNTPHELVRYPFFDLGKAPKGKLPFIDDGDTRVADSGFIIEYLKKTYGDPLDASISPRDWAIGHAMRRLIEENLYWVTTNIRWRIDENWSSFMEQIFDDFEDKAMLEAVLPKVREAVLQTLHGHGLGRHSVDEVWHIGKQDVSALAEFLADKPFFLGPEPTSLDATAYAALAALQGGFDSPVAEHIRAQDNLVAYQERMKARYYAD
ncbi:glutathione S-transferase C-terminal domain-containing protein [Haliangium sp.]|uniref:glutathione S-transferase C-terminal domain-containing protein n=1 Tax=Haliangium sp. TaxID=2663208 RepID=UPI003D10CA46